MNNIIETIGFSTGLDALDKSKQFGHVLVNTLADTCPACQAFKSDLPDLINDAKAKGVQVINIKAEDSNKEFFEKYQCETLPYTFVFANGEFVGGDSFDKNSFSQLLTALSEVNESN
jgi:thiol-disulfide isomerase/thioredoxin